jgi:hypothetical protein
MKRRHLLLVVFSFALGGAFLLWRWGAPGRERSVTELRSVYYSAPEEYADFVKNRAPSGTGWVHLPRPRADAPYRSADEPALRGFVKPEVCGECHADKYQGHLGTAHFRTSLPASPDTVMGSFSGAAASLATRDPTLRFEMREDGSNLTQCVVVREGGEEYVHERPLDIVIGSGNHGQTYLYWQGDELFQLPISYFSESGGWVNSPGLYRDGTADFARGISRRCLDCHATYFAPAPGEVARYDRENFILGVTCVRCHGHGWAHVQYHRTHPDEKMARYIVHPGKLPRDRANEVCAQCHSGGGQLLGAAFSYQPGEPLDQYMRLDAGIEDPRNDDPHAANQLDRLKKSRCYEASDSLTCATCHDPHQAERGKLQVFAQRCGKCHQSGDCGLAAELGKRIDDHCIECHMPSRRDAEGVMQTTEGDLLPLLRDHFIKVWPETSQQVRRKLATP